MPPQGSNTSPAPPVPPAPAAQASAAASILPATNKRKPTSHYMGVSWNSHDRRWVAHIIERLVNEHGFLSPPYPDPNLPGVYRVPLGGHDITRREAIVDAESLPLIKDASCHMASTSEGVEFVSVSINGEHIPLRRLIMGVADRNRQVGHRNGDPLDCRRQNLIVRTSKQRSWTSRKRKLIDGKPPTSRFKGVFWDRCTSKWRARIQANGRSYSLGRYHDEVEAAEAYDMAAKKFFGEHAWLNFPDNNGRLLLGEGPSKRLAA